ncbi:hypothetical protein BPAE_0158g00060 [Botrytis paeoniae]|uniref:Uncharacterized protein n=1 Tax=Botrytis paeoniae TaxID=278948 RepID=A0A4Z1FM15_9HELO|nr:hypothetical protein BPAE_0158g00060 [Botrytis paeoniae]
MGSDSTISIGSSPRDSNDSDTTLPMISDLSPPDFNRSNTTLSRTSDLSFPDFNKSDTTFPRVSEFFRPDSNGSDFTLPKMPNLSRPDSNTSNFTLPGFSNPLAPNNSSTQLRNYPNPLVPNNFRPSAPYNFGPIVENYSGVTDPRNLRLSIPDGYTLNSGPSWECSRDPSNRQDVVAAVQRTKTTAELIEELRCNHPISHTVPEHKLTDQVAAALMTIPSVPDYIFFRYYLQGREVWANDYALVRDLKWGNDDYMELRAFNMHTGIEYHGCMVGWCQKSV